MTHVGKRPCGITHAGHHLLGKSAVDIGCASCTPLHVHSRTHRSPQTKLFYARHVKLKACVPACMSCGVVGVVWCGVVCVQARVESGPLVPTVGPAGGIVAVYNTAYSRDGAPSAHSNLHGDGTICFVRRTRMELRLWSELGWLHDAPCPGWSA